MPLYYRLQLVSIYTYLEQRFGFWSYKTGAGFFLVSRLLGSSARFFLVLSVLHQAIFQAFGVPFWVSVGIGLLLIWVYTYKGGMKTIILTDTLQTVCMLVAVVVSIYYVSGELGLSFLQIPDFLKANPMAEVWNTDVASSQFWAKSILSGAFIAITMTGLDQDMMQKNLTCRSIGEAQKNMYTFSGILFFVNILFLSLGVLLYAYAAQFQVAIPGKSDQLFPLLALQHFPAWVGVMFLMGIIAATYASTDSALTALTTSFCFDFLNFKSLPEESRKSRKFYVHLAMSAMVWVVVLFFNRYNQGSLIITVFEIAGYTYGPLLGLYALGLFSHVKPYDAAVPLLSVVAAVSSYFIKFYSKQLFGGYEIGFEVLLLNGLLTAVLLWASSFYRRD